MKKILMVSSEAVPFIKTGGLADVVGSLPRYFNKEEYDVRIILPKYACMDQRFLPDLQFVCHFYVNLNWRKQYAGIFKTEYKGVTYYFVDNEFYFAGNNPYNNIHEDIEKFAFFSKAVLMALPYIDFCPDVIHCNDWQTGLVPVLLKTDFCKDSYYVGMKTVFSIHNMKFQGRWHVRDVMDITGLPASIFTADKLESYGEANYLKGGCVYADAISTVSPSYASDITTPEGGEGLDGLLSARRDSLYGIVNGIDYDDFNPATDAAMVEHFSIDNVVDGKKANKRALQQSMGLPEKENAFLIGMVSRLTDQKGFDLVAYVMEEMLSTMDVQFVVLGTGEYRFEEMFHYFQSKYPDKISSYIGYSEEKAHQIYASCDAFLMPSLFEPCGLSQMMSMRYGTLPIVRETGGLKDTVEPYNEYENKGTGFSFAAYNAHDMMHVIKYANYVFSNQKEQWNGIVKRAMKTDFSWDASARKYEELYDKLILQ
ncbi:MAG: glycogen synthase GlgA [Lachnospiraceae bacterium]|nr:glycogen synthase GlgA [Lachnospiraceae bacterium]